MKLSKEEKIQYIKDHPDASLDELAVALGYKNADSVRQFCKRHKLPNKRHNVQAGRTIERNLPELVYGAIKTKPRTLVYLADLFKVPPADIEEALRQLRRDHVNISDLGNAGFLLAHETRQIEAPFKIDISKHPTTEVPYGFVADTHLGSKYERLDVLEALYDRFAEAGVETVFHGGNWIDGEHRRINWYDIYVHGVEDQIKNFTEKYPAREGIVTKIISGDDHEGWYVKQARINVGQKMVDEACRYGRYDLVDLGYMERDIQLKQSEGSSIMRVMHAGGGSAYAHSYTAQKIAESLQGGEKPTIILAGHYHKFNYAYPREVHIIQGGCTQTQTPWMRKNKLQAMVGGVLFWVRQAANGVVTSVRVEWIPFYDQKFYQFRW